jgi:hypothetical protein
MQPGIHRAHSFAPLVGLSLSLLVAVAIAQAPSSGPVAAMFGDDQKRDPSLALSFLSVDLPATNSAAFPARVYLSAGDLERAFDRAEFRPDAAIIPTNTDLQISASAPATQRVLIDRVQKQADVMRDLEDQIAARRKQSPPSGGEPGLLRIGLDSFMAQLPRRGNAAQTGGPFPKAACLVATDFADGGAVDRRELFVQDRVRKGIAACLAGLDGGGAQSVVLPLMGAGSSKTQTNDPMYEGQRTLKECRLINSTAGIALGIHDFAADRRSLREIGLVQWDQEVVGMFKVPAGSRAAQSAQVAYRNYAEQVKQAFRKGLAGQKTVASDLNGACNAILNVR